MTHAEEVKPQNITVGTFMDQWFDFAKPNLKPSTIKRYREAIEVYISNPLSGMPSYTSWTLLWFKDCTRPCCGMAYLQRRLTSCIAYCPPHMSVLLSGG
jgi:hypothetical protein